MQQLNIRSCGGPGGDAGLAPESLWPYCPKLVSIGVSYVEDEHTST